MLFRSQHIPFALKREHKADIVAACEAVEEAMASPEELAELLWPHCLDAGKLTAEEFAAAIEKDPVRGGRMLHGLLANEKEPDIKALVAATETKVAAAAIV